MYLLCGLHGLFVHLVTKRTINKVALLAPLVYLFFGMLLGVLSSAIIGQWSCLHGTILMYQKVLILFDPSKRLLIGSSILSRLVPNVNVGGRSGVTTWTSTYVPSCSDGFPSYGQSLSH